MASMGGLDVVLLAVLGVSALVGLWRGVVYEVLSLGGWLVAWLAAQAWGHALAVAWLPATWPAGVSGLAGYALMFVGVLVIWRVLVWLIQQLLHASPVAPVDRALGGVFGLLRGVVVVLAGVMLIGMTPLAHHPVWQASAGVQWAQWGLEALAPVLPGDGWMDRWRSPSPVAAAAESKTEGSAAHPRGA
jgi:membrane protein required for colicin V production